MWQVVKITSNISKKAAQNQAYTTLPKCLLNFWAIILEVSASNNPPDVAAIRAVFFGWVLYCWAFNTVYQAHLTIFLIDPGLRHQVSSEDEILTSGIEYSTVKSMIFLYPDLKGTRYRRLNVTVEVDLAQARVAIGTLAFLYSNFLVEYNTDLKYKDANGVLSICKIKDDFCFQFGSDACSKWFPAEAEVRQSLTFFTARRYIELVVGGIKVHGFSGGSQKIRFSSWGIHCPDIEAFAVCILLPIDRICDVCFIVIRRIIIPSP